MKLVLVNLGLALVLAAAPPSHADIFQWEYVNPADPGQGKQQSTTLAPGGAGVNAAPLVNLSGRNLTKAYFIAKDLQGAKFDSANVTDADFSQANLTGASFYPATLAGANFTGAQVQGAILTGDFTPAQLYSTASYQSHDLTGIALAGNLAAWNFSGQNLAKADLSFTQIAGANLAGAQILETNFDSTNVTAAQLYSTASYHNHNLNGIRLGSVTLNLANFVGQNLDGARFFATKLVSANFSQANAPNADFGLASLNSANFSQAILPGASFNTALLNNANFTDANLKGVIFAGATVTDAKFINANLMGAYFASTGMATADFTDADVRSANLRGITKSQLLSTGSYRAHDLSGVTLYDVDLSAENFGDTNLSGGLFYRGSFAGVNFTRANLAKARFEFPNFQGANFSEAVFNGTTLYFANATAANLRRADLSRVSFEVVNLTDADLTLANLANAYVPATTLTRANMTGVDARGAQYLTIPETALTDNLIHDDGHIADLSLTGAEQLIIRDYDGDTDQFDQPRVPPLPIVVEQSFDMEAGGILEMQFESDAWNSVISFAPSIMVKRSGTLNLLFADGTDVAAQVGRTLKVFDWTGVSPTGAFAVSSPYHWDLSRLYSTGEITLTAVPEPSTVVLLAMAAGIGIGRRRNIHVVSKLIRRMTHTKNPPHFHPSCDSKELIRFLGIVAACRKLICAVGLTLGRRSGRDDAPPNQLFWHMSR